MGEVIGVGILDADSFSRVDDGPKTLSVYILNCFVNLCLVIVEIIKNENELAAECGRASRQDVYFDCPKAFLGF